MRHHRLYLLYVGILFALFHAGCDLIATEQPKVGRSALAVPSSETSTPANVTAKTVAIVPLRRLYVSPRGSDQNDGLSLGKAFQTISKAASITEPGDLVLVSGGTYFEHVQLKRPGTADNPIVFRAVPGETAHVTFGHRIENWRKVAGTRCTYAAKYEYIPHLVWEDRTVSRYVEVAETETLNHLPGAFMYDFKTKELSVHPLWGRTPEEAVIVAVPYSLGGKAARVEDKQKGEPKEGMDYATRIMQSLYAWDKGIWSLAAYNHVEGFLISYQPVGIQIRADYCEARGNTIYACTAGVTTYATKDAAIEQTVIERNTCYLNYGFGIQISRIKDGLVGENELWDNGPNDPFRDNETGAGGILYNLAIYGVAENVSFIGNRVIAEDTDRHYYLRKLFRYKHAQGRSITRNNLFVGGGGDLGLGTEEASDVSFNTVVGGGMKSRKGPDYPDITPEAVEKGQLKVTVQGNLFLEKGVQPDSGFADPVRGDYRLRKDSPYLGQGAYPDVAPVCYVSPEGCDTNDGVTPKSAWKTIARAVAGVQPGRTIYVLPGVYLESVTVAVRATADKPVEIKTHGRGRVVIDGGGKEQQGVVFQNATHVVLDGFIVRGFTGNGIRIEKGEGLRLQGNVLDRCGAGIALQNGKDVCVENNTLVRCGTGVDIRGGGERLTLRNNLFVDATAEPIRRSDGGTVISERNAFSGGNSEAWLAAWRQSVYEAHPSLPVQAALAGPDYLLPTNSELSFQGLGHRPLGARPDAAPEEPPILIENFRTVALAPHYAVVAWETPCDFPDAQLAWKSGDGKTGKASFQQDSRLKETQAKARLDNLVPGGEYVITLNVTASKGRKGKAEIKFKTPLTLRDPSVLYVAPGGNDSHDGLSREKPFRTISVATFAAVPGDTISVAPGVYPELVELWCGGLSPEKRLTFRSEKLGEAVIRCETIRPGALRATGLKHVMIDGFCFRGLGYGGIPVGVQLKDCEDVVFVNNVFEPRPGHNCSCMLLQLSSCRDVDIVNNVFNNGFNGVALWKATGRVVIDRNTFYLGGVGAVVIQGENDGHWRIVNNIFVDTIGNHSRSAAVAVYRPSKNIVCDYNLYCNNVKEYPMALFGYKENEAGKVYSREEERANNAMTIDEMKTRFEVGQHSRIGDPMFVDQAKGDFRLKPGSPALGMGNDGGNAGFNPDHAWGR